MPSLLSAPYPAIISNLPVQQHSVAVDAARWSNIFQMASLTPLHTAIFGVSTSVDLRRCDLLHPNHGSTYQRCAEILLWGYPSNQRGIPEKLLPQFPSLVPAATTVTNDWGQYYSGFSGVRGASISTISKLAYFHGCRFQNTHKGKNHGALILDSRVISVSARWTELAPLGLTYQNAVRRYLDYLDAVEAVAAGIGATPDQIELFLFALGGSF